MYATTTPDHPYLPNVELSVHVLGREYSSLCDWRWSDGCQDETYSQIRRMFVDNKSALYSIQNITMLGLAVDKPIGSWFGPNTVAQVIKKLSAYDPTTRWYVHISVEDGVIVDEIKTRCRTKSGSLASNGDGSDSQHALPVPSMLLTDGVEDSEWNLEAIKTRFTEDAEVIDAPTHVNGPVMRDLDEDFLEIVLPPTFDEGPYAVPEQPTPSLTDSLLASECTEQGASLGNTYSSMPLSASMCESQSEDVGDQVETITTSDWRPLLLFIPLRLGLHKPNPCYFDALKAVLRIPHCIGIMGGRPSHAVWIVGTVGADDLVCLDPHSSQPASRDDLTTADDLTHHCSKPVRISMHILDPSMVIGFVCPTESDLDDLCARFTEGVLVPEVSGGRPLFELHTTRPSNLPPLPSFTTGTRASTDRESVHDGPEISTQIGMTVEVPESDSSSTASPCVLMATTDETVQGDGRIGEAVNAVRNLWSRCNQVAGDTVRSIATSYRTPGTKSNGAEFELV